MKKQNQVCRQAASRDQNTKIRKFKMADGRHFENGFIAISRPRLIRFQWNLVCWRSLLPRTAKWKNDKILQIQNGGGPPFWKWFYRYISAGNHPISMKFGEQTQILVPRMVTCWFIKNLCNLSCHIENCLLAKSLWVIVRLTWYLVCTCTCSDTPLDENSNFRKFKMADGRHFENGFITISRPQIIQFQWNLVCHCRFWF